MAAARQWLRGGREEVVAPTAMAAVPTSAGRDRRCDDGGGEMAAEGRVQDGGEGMAAERRKCSREM